MKKIIEKKSEEFSKEVSKKRYEPNEYYIKTQVKAELELRDSVFNFNQER
jgi:hypothetical protein